MTMTDQSNTEFHPAACPYCGGRVVNQVQPDYNLRPARLNDDGTISYGDVVEGSDFEGPDLLFCHGCGSTYIQPKYTTATWDSSITNDEYGEHANEAIPGDRRYLGRKVTWFAVQENEWTAKLLDEAKRNEPSLVEPFELALGLKAAMHPLIEWKNEHLDIADKDEDTTRRRLWDAAVSIDQAFDDLDSAVRTLEDEEPDGEEPAPEAKLFRCRHCGCWINTALGVNPPDGEERAGTEDDPRAPGDWDDICDVCNYRDGKQGGPPPMEREEP